MWSPTHVQVTVQRAKGLITKGKNGTNNCFVTIALGKEKYQTSIREKASQNVEWHEECELAIPDKGNTAELILTCLHHNSLSIDEFLGQITLPLRDMDAYDRPRSKWFKLLSKPGQEKKDKERGELEIRINFTVKAGSMSDLNKKEKHKSSLNQLASSVGGSLLSIGTLEKKKGFKKIATSIGSKLHLTGKKKNKKGDEDSESFTGSIASIGTPNSSLGGSRKWNGRSYIGNTDPGVAEDGDLNFDKLSRRSSNSSLSYTQEQINNLQFSNRIASPLSGNFANGSPEIRIQQHSTHSSASVENDSKPYINSNQLDIDNTASLKKRAWGKTRVPIPIPERSEDELIKNGNQKYDIRSGHFENDDNEVILREKDEPILQENRNSEMLEVPETHKPKPRQFIPSSGDDDFTLDNLSSNSSPYSSLTSQSYYDYNPYNDSGRSSRKIEEDDDDSGFGTFNRGDSKRRASRKKYFTPVPKGREFEEKLEEPLQADKNEIIIDFEPKPKPPISPRLDNNKMKIEENIYQTEDDISKDLFRSNAEGFKKPAPPVRRIKNLEKSYNNLNFEKIKEENIALECQIADKYEKIYLENVASSENKIKIFETKTEEKISFPEEKIEIEKISAPLTAEVKDMQQNISKYDRQPETLIEKFPYFVNHKNEVSNLTIQLGSSINDENENMEITGAQKDTNLKTLETQNDDLIYNENESELRKSNSSVNFEIRDLKNESFSSYEDGTNRISVSSIRSRFEQNSSNQNSPFGSPRASFRRSVQNDENFGTKYLEPEKSSEIKLNLIGIIPKKDENVFEKIKIENSATTVTPIERFEKASTHHMAVEYNVAKVYGIKKEENIAKRCDVAEIYENTKIENIASENFVKELFETSKEENIAVESNFAEIFENTRSESVVEESYISQIFEIRKEENIATPCLTVETYYNANAEYLVEKLEIPKSLEQCKEEHFAIVSNVPELFEKVYLANIVEKHYIPQVFEIQKEVNVATQCSTAETYENAIIEYIVEESEIFTSSERFQERNIAVEFTVPEVFEKVNSEYIVEKRYIPQIFEIQKVESLATQCLTAGTYNNAIVEYFVEEFEISKNLEQCKEENFTIVSNVPELFENVNLENIVEEHYIPQVFENRREENVATQCTTAETYENAITEYRVEESEILTSSGQYKDQNIAVECGIAEILEKLNSENIIDQKTIVEIDDIPPITENCKETNIAENINVFEIFENVQMENLAIEKQIAQDSHTRNESSIATNCSILDISETISSKNVAAEMNIVNISNIETKATEVTSKVNEHFNDTEDLQIISLVPIPKPRSPVSFSDNNINKSSSNIFQIIENKEDSPGNKSQETFKIPNSSTKIDSDNEDDYESLYSEPELRTNITASKLKINDGKVYGDKSEMENDSKSFDIINSKSFEDMPIPRPRNPNGETFNYLAGSSSSNCSSIENFNITSVMPKHVGNQDPGVIEDDDEFVFDKLSHKSSGSSLNINRANNDYNHRVPSPIITKEEDTRNNKMPSPPAKPPRNASDPKLDEWETKLYGSHLDIGNTDSLKRRSWGNNRIPLNATDENEEYYEDVKLSSPNNNGNNTNTTEILNDIKTSPTPSGKLQQRSDTIIENISEAIPNKDNIEKIYEEKPVSPKMAIKNPEPTEKKESKLEKLLNKSPILRTQSRDTLIDDVDPNINKKSTTVTGKSKPKLLPRSDTIAEFTDDIIQSPEDAKEIREKLRKDQKEISEKTEKIEKKHRFGKFKYFAKRVESKIDEGGFHGERHNPIGHENFNDNENSLPELSPDLLNKYDGKSREDIILIADSFEKDMIIERNRVKELEEYLDNLLLRVMETHPKILQNPYRTNSTKSG